MFSSNEFFNVQEKEQIASAIKQAEKQTSGEIRIFIENKCKGEVLDRAAFLFAELKMHETELRNGVLFYLAFSDKKFAIIGDAGINQKVENNFWDEIKVSMLEHFGKHEFASGLAKGIGMAGDALKKYFPYTDGDKNELSDDIVFGK